MVLQCCSERQESEVYRAGGEVCRRVQAWQAETGDTEEKTETGRFQVNGIRTEDT